MSDDRYIIVTDGALSFAINLGERKPAQSHHLLEIHQAAAPEARLYYAEPEHGFASKIGWAQAHLLCDAPAPPTLRAAKVIDIAPVDAPSGGYKPSLSDDAP